MNRIKRFTLIFLSLLFYQSVVYAQLATMPLNDSIFPKMIKRPWVNSVENLGINIIINRFDANIANRQWARVTPTSWWRNLSSGFEMDYDHFTTNWLGHPVHGSLFYNAARSNGYNFWQSIPFTIGGSLIWEYFGETYRVSKNDLIITSLGGIYMGELTHKFSEIIKLKIKNRFARTTFSTIINPVAQINSWVIKDNKQQNRDTLQPLLNGQLAMGGSFPGCQLTGNTWGTRGYLSFSLNYGDLFNKTPKAYKPFDYFNFKTWANFGSRGRDSIYFNISSHAALLAKHINKNTVVSLSQHYDFLASDIYEIGSLAITGDYSIQHQWSGSNYLMGSVKAGAILFGSSKSDIVNFIYHSNDPEFLRDYVYGNGFTGEVEVLFKTKKMGSFTGNFNRWVIYTDSDTKGIEDLVLMVVEYDYPIWRKLNIGIQYNYYKHLAHYYNYPKFLNIKNDYNEFKALISLHF